MSGRPNSIALPFERVRRRERLLPTPEGVPLRVAVAEPGERIAAFIADVFLSFAGALALTLRSLGIEKGKPFNPSDAMKALMTSAAKEGALVCSTATS